MCVFVVRVRMCVREPERVFVLKVVCLFVCNLDRYSACEWEREKEYV